jgi:hypothetical protein
MMQLSPSSLSLLPQLPANLCLDPTLPCHRSLLFQSAAEAQRRAMADELQRARLSMREEEALIERKRAALNADIERAQRAQSDLIKVRRRPFPHLVNHCAENESCIGAESKQH